MSRRDDFWLRLHEIAGTFSEVAPEPMLDVLAADFARFDPVTQKHLAAELQSAGLGLSKLLEMIRLLPSIPQAIE